MASVVHCHHQHTIQFAIKLAALLDTNCITMDVITMYCLINAIQCAYSPKALSQHSRNTRAGLIVPRLQGLAP